ncbi:MAG: hypothetical protein ACRDOI_22165, partial [Trebonia sp.]
SDSLERTRRSSSGGRLHVTTTRRDNTSNSGQHGKQGLNSKLSGGTDIHGSAAAHVFTVADGVGGLLCQRNVLSTLAMSMSIDLQFAKTAN